MNVVGLDLSLTSTGVACEGHTDVIEPKGFNGIERLDWLSSEILEHFPLGIPSIAIIEGYSYGSKNNREVLGELGGVVRFLLWRRSIPFVVVPPTTLKKYATGKGNGNKDAVIQAAAKRSDETFKDNNAVDAWWLRQIGLARLWPDSGDVVSMPAINRSALDAIEWPDLVSSI